MIESRATHADRRAVIRVLRVAAEDGRLDAGELDVRVRAAESARTLVQLHRLHVDLPEGRDDDAWLPGYRIRRVDREQVLRRLLDALAEGRLTTSDHERREREVAAAVTYGDLGPAVDGLPDTPGTAPADVLLSTADRQAALTEVEAAITSGRVDPQAWDGAAAWIDQAVRQRELDALAADLELRAGPAERDATRAELDQALADGRLTPAEHTDRARAAAAADTDHELAALLADLHRPRRGRRRSKPADHRVSHRERDEAARALRRAHAKGQLDLAEYDDRVAAAYAAATRLELDNLLADLREPTAPAEPDIIDYIYQRFDHWHRYSTGTPHMALTPRDKAPRPGIADILLHKRPWQVVMILTWGGYLCWLLATLIHALLGGGWDGVLLPVVLVTPVVVLTDFYTYAVVRRTIRRRRLSRPH